MFHNVLQVSIIALVIVIYQVNSLVLLVKWGPVGIGWIKLERTLMSSANMKVINSFFGNPPFAPLSVPTPCSAYGRKIG